VLSGYHSPHAQAEHLRWVLQRHTHPKAPLLAVSYTTRTKMADIVADALASIDKHFGLATPIDLVGISMGGLIARAISTHAALPSQGGVIPARVPANTRRAFTLASPHAGALLADKITPNAAAKDMKAGSDFLTALDKAQHAASYELCCYSRLRDGWVGAQRSAPPGHGVIWTSGAVWGSHFTVTWDPRILADLCRRLRGESPLGAPGTPPRN
jgi:pimeloyl-ACP methyl ester carboxylesterase